jgi:hypothetical protein
MSLIITLGQSCQQGLKTPENPEKMDEEKILEEKTPDGKETEVGCRCALFEDDESGPNDRKLVEWEWENGFQLGIRLDFEKSLWSDLSGLREGRPRDSTLSD